MFLSEFKRLFIPYCCYAVRSNNRTFCVFREIIKELSTENSMQCLKHNVTEKDLEKTVINGQAPLEQQVLNKIVSSPKVRRNFIPYPVSNFTQQCHPF